MTVKVGMNIYIGIVRYVVKMLLRVFLGSFLYFYNKDLTL